ncbi:MAG TPA: GNAT family N-acetyltransferase [Gemmataceae bacterium]|nr:GNAT family N-acetyltransferase [Gemmataceae bacterium]
MTIDIRRATLADLDLVAPLFDRYRQFYGCSEDLELARRFLGERLERGESVIFVAVVDGKGVGFTQLYPTFTSIGVRRAWLLNDLYVSSDARRMGIGRRLMDAAKTMAVGMGAAWLELATATDNHAAQALYRSCGYKKDEKYDRFKLTLK